MGSRNIHEVNDLNFEFTVSAAHAPVLLDFTAAWCPPCRALGHVLARIADERAGRLLVASVDSDANPGLGATFRVRGLPTLVLLVEGKEVARRMGLATREQLIAWLDGALAERTRASAAGY